MKAVVLLLLATVAWADFLVDCPKPRTKSISRSSNLCGGAGPSSGPTTHLAPGPQTLIWRELRQHQGSAFRIELWNEQTKQNCTLLDHYPHNDAVTSNSISTTDEDTQPHYKVTVNIPNWQCSNCSLHIVWVIFNGQACKHPASTPPVPSPLVTTNCQAMYSCADVIIDGALTPDFDTCGAPNDWPFSDLQLANNVYFRQNKGEKSTFNPYGFPRYIPDSYANATGGCRDEALDTGADLGSVSVAVGILVYGVSQAEFETKRDLFIQIFAAQAGVLPQDVTIHNVLPNDVFGGVKGIIIQVQVATTSWYASTQALQLQAMATDNSGVGSPLAVALTNRGFAAGADNVVLFNTPVVTSSNAEFFNPMVTVQNRVVAFIVAPLMIFLIGAVAWGAGRSMTQRCLGTSNDKLSLSRFKLASLISMLLVFFATTIAVGTYYWARLSSQRFGLWQRCPGDGTCHDPVDPIDGPGVETIIILRVTALLNAILCFPMIQRVYQLWSGTRELSDRSALNLSFAISCINLFNMSIWAGYFNDVLANIYSSTLFPGYTIAYGYSFVFITAAWIIGFFGCICLYQVWLVGTGASAKSEGGGGEGKEGHRSGGGGGGGGGARGGNTELTNMNVTANAANQPPPLAPRPAQHHSTGSYGNNQPHRPPPARPGAAGAGGLPSGWAEQKSAKGEVYYYNAMTGESRWDKPTA